jgi:hypothetical protein
VLPTNYLKIRIGVVMSILAFSLLSAHANENSNRDSFLRAPTEPPRREKPDYTWYPVSVMVVFVGMLIWGFFIVGKGTKVKKLKRVKTKKKYGRWMNRPY